MIRARNGHWIDDPGDDATGSQASGTPKTLILIVGGGRPIEQLDDPRLPAEPDRGTSLVGRSIATAILLAIGYLIGRLS